MKKALRQSQKETLAYVQQMLGDLKRMCMANRLDEVGYFVEMAYIHASDQVRDEGAHRAGPEAA